MDVDIVDRSAESMKDNVVKKLDVATSTRKRKTLT